MAFAMSPSDIEYQLAHIHDNRSDEIITAGAICISMAIGAVVLRLISRQLSRVGSVQLDDYVIISSLLFEIGEVVTQFICVHYGEGRHAVLLKHPLTFGKLLMTTSSMYIVALATVKISVLFFYRRIFPSPRFHMILRIVGGFIICYSLVQLLVLIFQCRPIQGAWDPFIKADCVHINEEITVMSAFNVLTGMTTLCLPIPLIWQLQVSKRSKIQLMSIFILGGLFCIVSIYRLVKVSEQLSLADLSYTNVDTQVWSVVEVCVAIVCACLPTFRPLFDPRVRKNSVQKKVPAVNYLAHDPTTAEEIGSTAITVTESTAIEIEPYPSNIDIHQDSNENDQGHADFLTMIRNNWQSPPCVKV